MQHNPTDSSIPVCGACEGGFCKQCIKEVLSPYVKKYANEASDVVVFTCDRCSRTIHPVDQIVDWQERFIISFRAGYGSIFGDGNYVEGQFCQECINDVLGQHLRVTSDDPYCSTYKSAIDAEKILQQYQFQKVINHKQQLAEIADIVRVGKEISPTRELLARRLGIPESQIALVAYEYLLRATKPNIQSV